MGRELWDGGRIREIREARGHSQDKLSDLTGVSKGDISRHERNDEKSNPSVAALARIALALHVPITALFESVGSFIPRSEGETGHAGPAVVGGGAGLADSLGRALREYEQTGEVPKGWRGDVLVAIFALTRALQRPESAAEPGGQAKEA